MTTSLKFVPLFSLSSFTVNDGRLHLARFPEAWLEPPRRSYVASVGSQVTRLSSRSLADALPSFRTLCSIVTRLYVEAITSLLLYLQIIAVVLLYIAHALLYESLLLFARGRLQQHLRLFAR